MNTTLANLGNLALVVPGLGDLAFYNTNSANALFVLKGDAEFLFGMSDLNYQELDPAVVQATEKSLAVKLLGNLP
jgi:glycerol-3-phosphate dehydrogenase